MSALLHAAGFQGLDWYYPLPDYKLPRAVLSETLSPKDTDSIWGLSPATTGRLPRREILSESLLGRTLAQAGLFGEFANSFLVIARRSPTAPTSRCLRFYGANYDRKPAYRTSVSIHLENGAKRVVKFADNCQAEDFIQELPARERLAQSFFAGRITVLMGKLDGTRMSYPYLEYPTLTELIAQAMGEQDQPGEQHLLDEYLEFVHSLPSKDCVPEEFLREFDGESRTPRRMLRCLDCAPVDCIPNNILVGPDGWNVIDSEWMLPFPMPAGFLPFRAICALTHTLQLFIQKRASARHPVVLLSGFRHPHYIPVNWLDILDHLEVPRKQLAQWEVGFQKMVLLRPPSRRNVWLPFTHRRRTKVRIQEATKASDLPFYIGRCKDKLAALVRWRRRPTILQPDFSLPG